jgi:hypothetical protein
MFKNGEQLSLREVRGFRSGEAEVFFVSRDSSVSIATRYGLDGPGIEYRWGGGKFYTPFQTGPGAQPASWGTG